MYPLQFYLHISSLAFLTLLFHYPLQYIHLEKKYFERYSVNLMRSVACFMISSQGFQHILDNGFITSITMYENEEYDLFYFFLAYIYFDTVLLIYQHFLGIEKKLRYDLLLHHLLALFSFHYIQNYNLYSLIPYIALSEGISITTGPKLLANVFQNKILTKYCILYRIYYLLFIRVSFLWPYILYLIYQNSSENNDFEFHNALIVIFMIYSMEYLWYIRGNNELKSIL